MIDEKEIKEAARDHINKGGFFVKYDEDPCIDIEVAFKSGAKWAQKEFVKSLWHPAKEEPKEKDKMLMVEVGKNKKEYVHFKRNQGCLFGGWKHYVNMVDVTRWLYIDDLLPKKGDEK